jgi:hypothetical protein
MSSLAAGTTVRYEIHLVTGCWDDRPEMNVSSLAAVKTAVTVTVLSPVAGP